MRRPLPHALTLAVGLTMGLAGPAPAQQGPNRPAARAGPEKPGAPPVTGCPSLANYRMLMHDGPAAAAARLADPKADHLGCAVLPRKRIAGIAERVALGGRTYACAEVQGTTACHWFEADALQAGPAGGSH